MDRYDRLVDQILIAHENPLYYTSVLAVGRLAGAHILQVGAFRPNSGRVGWRVEISGRFSRAAWLAGCRGDSEHDQEARGAGDHGKAVDG
jgi:hypothetical protein